MLHRLFNTICMFSYLSIWFWPVDGKGSTTDAGVAPRHAWYDNLTCCITSNTSKLLGFPFTHAAQWLKAKILYVQDSSECVKGKIMTSTNNMAFVLLESFRAFVALPCLHSHLMFVTACVTNYWKQNQMQWSWLQFIRCYNIFHNKIVVVKLRNTAKEENTTKQLQLEAGTKSWSCRTNNQTWAMLLQQVSGPTNQD